MILNIDKIKTQALLLICQDLILTYQNSNSEIIEQNDEINSFVAKAINEILRELSKSNKPYEFYIKQNSNFQAKAIFFAYKKLYSLLDAEFQNGVTFNPAMLVFSLLASWFAELGKQNSNKEYIYFIIYPYSIYYDKLLLNSTNQEFKTLNINMINIAEKIMVKFDRYNFK